MIYTIPMDPHFVGKVNLKAIIRNDDGKILIARDHKDRGTWDFIGGRMHSGEPPEMGLRREAQEELGVDIILDGVVLMEQVPHISDGGDYLFITFRATLADPKDPLKLPSDELAEVVWVDKESIKKYKLYDSCVNAMARYWEEG